MPRGSSLLQCNHLRSVGEGIGGVQNDVSKIVPDGDRHQLDAAIAYYAHQRDLQGRLRAPQIGFGLLKPLVEFRGFELRQQLPLLDARAVRA